ncbi:MAG: DUF2202 domain-containing protein [Bacteroidota bacterium]|nr:DUF2202 domain-containing protein [Bacteroidota bacterium]
MKNLLIVAIMIVVTATSCKKDEEKTSSNDIGAQINDFPKESLNADELASLKIMREEEKLAHDVYMNLYRKWNTPIFSNIAASEQTHSNAVLTLLNKYQITDPVGNNAEGIFTDTTLQTIYNQLVVKGNSSNLDGFIVGATVEDLDIFDLNHWLTKIDNQDIKFVYENLNKGSRNHLRSFYTQILQSGGTYKAQYLTQEQLEAIINSPKETGSW